MVTVTGPAPTTIEPWWQSSDLCPCQAPLPCMEPPTCCSGGGGVPTTYEYQLPCEVLVPPPAPPPSVAPRPPLPQPPLQTQIELEEDDDVEDDAAGQDDPKTEQEDLVGP